mmetsp:Transcript_19278/g.43477  ORF Transcript_19278/g.43477 Transcript_19278/m.43477 type:complete len:874 (-) Transcript_19278:1776-4397(-)
MTQYAIDAAKLVEKCRLLLGAILSMLEERSPSEKSFRRKALQLLVLADALKCVDRLIHAHVLDLLDREMEYLSSIIENDSSKREKIMAFFGEAQDFPTLMNTARTLREAERVANEYRKKESRSAYTASQFEKKSHRSTPIVFGVDDNIEDGYSVEGWYSGAARVHQQSDGDISPIITKEHRRNSTDAMVPNQTPLSPTKHRGVCISSRSEEDSSLFRLVVTLQLCLVRIEEANAILCKGRAKPTDDSGPPRRFRTDSITCDIEKAASVDSDASSEVSSAEFDQRTRNKIGYGGLIFAAGLAGGTLVLSSRNRRTTQVKLVSAGRTLSCLAVISFVRKRWRIICMNARIANSAEVAEDWILSWILLVNKTGSTDKFIPSRKVRRVLPLTLNLLLRSSNPQLPQPVIWYSNASIRYQLMKRGMDLLYASVGKAIELTRGKTAQKEDSPEGSKSSSLWTYVVASMAASYYNIIGPGHKSLQVQAMASSTLIQGAWGLVSLSGVKRASLEATRILKGASIAECIEVHGINCYVLSRDPFPALSSAIRRFKRQQRRGDSRLGTIPETATMPKTLSQVDVNVKGFPHRNVILHLCGGGFVAHTIAGDLPYLLDWSAASDSVVIIPEYAVGAQHRFPVAVEQIKLLYTSLRSGTSIALLGFQPSQIVLSGESVGGNLATALCVSLISDHEIGQCVELTQLQSSAMVSDASELDNDKESQAAPTGDSQNEERSYNGIELPNALLMSSPMLSLSLESTPSRVEGADDAVLPSALFAAISNSYVGPDHFKEDPLISPLFAADEVLRFFPTTLIFASSEDPLLDDSVQFNGRLRSLGVKSTLKAVSCVPHAFWALTTAGVPEARSVQRQCEEFLAKIFRVVRKV